MHALQAYVIMQAIVHVHACAMRCLRQFYPDQSVPHCTYILYTCTYTHQQGAKAGAFDKDRVNSCSTLDPPLTRALFSSTDFPKNSTYKKNLMVHHYCNCCRNKHEGRA